MNCIAKTTAVLEQLVSGGNMKICFPIEEDDGLDSRISVHFGSAAKLVVFDTDTKSSIVFHNSSNYPGCLPFTAIGGMLIDAVVVDAISEKALGALRLHGVDVIPRLAPTISATLHLIREQKQPEVTADERRKKTRDQCLYHALCPDRCSWTEACPV